MFKDVVPLWARHFARLVERLYRRGVLDRQALGVERLPGSRQMVSRGVRYGIFVVVVIVALIVFAEFIAQITRLGDRCLFPPCY
jgi:small-conductance mechanosensitive channel